MIRGKAERYAKYKQQYGLMCKYARRGSCNSETTDDGSTSYGYTTLNQPIECCRSQKLVLNEKQCSVFPLNKTGKNSHIYLEK